MEKELKKIVEECAAYQTNGRRQASEPLKLALEYVNRPMQSIDVDFFTRNNNYYLIWMDHYCGLPMFPTTASC